MADSFSKKEREKKKRKKKQEKAERREQKKQEETGGEEFVYVDEFGNFTDTPPDPDEKTEVKLEDIDVSVPKDSDIEEDPIKEGFVKFFNEEKRFGFICEKSTQQDYFVHEENLISPIKDKDKVRFEVEMGLQGPVAVNVDLLRE